VIYLAIVNVRLDGVAPRAFADAFMQREQTATVWVEDSPRTSRLTFDLEAPDPLTAEKAAAALTRQVAEAAGGAAVDALITITTDRDRLREVADRGGPSSAL
jgi:hypothetical protein